MPNLNVTYAEMSDSATRMRNNKNDIDARLDRVQDHRGPAHRLGFRHRPGVRQVRRGPHRVRHLGRTGHGHPGAALRSGWTRRSTRCRTWTPSWPAPSAEVGRRRAHAVIPASARLLAVELDRTDSAHADHAGPRPAWSADVVVDADPATPVRDVVKTLLDSLDPSYRADGRRLRRRLCLPRRPSRSTSAARWPPAASTTARCSGSAARARRPCRHPAAWSPSGPSPAPAPAGSGAWTPGEHRIGSAPGCTVRLGDGPARRSPPSSG